jgi:hypothetical protein
MRLRIDEVKARALASDMAQHPVPPSGERRANPRTTKENHTTNLVQMILRDPAAAGDLLDEDIATGADPELVLGLLDAAEAVLRLRGVDAAAKLAGLRHRLERHIRRPAR